MPIAKDSGGDPARSLDSKETAPSFGLAVEKLREATRMFEKARQRGADEELPAACVRDRLPAGTAMDGDVDAIRRALLVKMFREGISTREPRR